MRTISGLIFPVAAAQSRTAMHCPMASPIPNGPSAMACPIGVRRQSTRGFASSTSCETETAVSRSLLSCTCILGSSCRISPQLCRISPTFLRLFRSAPAGGSGEAAAAVSRGAGPSVAALGAAGVHARCTAPGDVGLLTQPRLVGRAGKLHTAPGGGGRPRELCAGRLLTADAERGSPPYQCTPLNTCANSLRARSTGDLGSAAISAAASSSLRPRAAAESGNSR